MALTYVFDGLSKVQLSPTKGKSALRFRLIFGSSTSQTETVQFEASAADAMEILRALQKVQTEQGWQARPSPSRGKPHLTLVSSDDDQT